LNIPGTINSCNKILFSKAGPADRSAVSRARIAVAASGGGSNFQALTDACREGSLKADICGLIASSANAGAVSRAEKAGIPYIILSKTEKQDAKLLEGRMLEQLRIWDCELLALTGFLLKIPDGLIDAYPDRILNIHPSLLPDYGGKGFYGLHVHRAVLQAGEKRSGCSVHIVNKAFDEGPVLARTEVQVKTDDSPETLAARVLAEEHRLYPSVIESYLSQLKDSSQAPSRTS
jgi:formyltetrahydrofolate-dependent phosphoribosylglycinamide formyltransferase